MKVPPSTISAITIMCLLATSCGTLKLATKAKAPDGSDFYATTEVTLFSQEGNDFDIAMGAKVNAKDTMLAVVLTSRMNRDHSIFKKGNKMKFSFHDGTGFTLSNMLDSGFDVENSAIIAGQPVSGVAYGYYYDPWGGLLFGPPNEVHGFVPTLGVSRKSTSYAFYLITCEQVRSISNKELTVFMLEADGRKLESADPDNVKTVFSQLYSFLKDNFCTSSK